MNTITRQFGTLNRRFLTRYSNKTTDVDLDGNIVEKNYMIFVRVKDCPVVREEGKTKYVETGLAPQAIVLDYGGTFYGYTEWKQVALKSPKYIFDDVNRENSSYTATFFRRIKYSYHNGRVYTKTIITINMPQSFKVRNTKKVLTEFIR